MFLDLENELIRILRANLSPTLVDSDRVVSGPLDDAPRAPELPTVAVTADRFEMLPEDDATTPRGIKELVAESFAPNGAGLFTLNRSPLEPLRAVEVEETPGVRLLLRERDDYVADYINGTVRLRREPAGIVHVQYFSLTPQRVVASVPVRINCRLDVFVRATGTDPEAELNAITTTVMGSIVANANAIEGLLSSEHDIVDSGLASLGTRRARFVFQTLQPAGGVQSTATQWQLSYTVDATMILVPADEQIGRMRYIDAGIAWDQRLVEMILAGTPPLLERAVTSIQGIGPVTTQTLADMGVTTVAQLADLRETGQTAIDSGISRARIVQARTQEIVRTVVRAGLDIPDATSFLSQLLADVQQSDLTAVAIPADDAGEIVTAISDILTETTVSNLRLSDLFFAPA